MQIVFDYNLKIWSYNEETRRTSGDQPHENWVREREKTDKKGCSRREQERIRRIQAEDTCVREVSRPSSLAPPGSAAAWTQ